MLGGACSPCCSPTCTDEFRNATWDALAAMPCSVSIPGDLQGGIDATTATTAMSWASSTQAPQLPPIGYSFNCRYFEKPPALSGDHALALDMSRSQRGVLIYFSYVSSTRDLEIAAQLFITTQNFNGNSKQIPNSQCYIRVGLAMAVNRRLYWVPAASVEAVAAANTTVDSSKANVAPYRTYTIATLNPQYFYPNTSLGKLWWSDTENKLVSGFSGAWVGDRFNASGTSEVSWESVYGNDSASGHRGMYSYASAFTKAPTSVSMSSSGLIAYMPQESAPIVKPAFVDPDGSDAYQSVTFAGRIETSLTFGYPAMTTTSGGKVFRYVQDTWDVTPTIRLG